MKYFYFLFALLLSSSTLFAQQISDKSNSTVSSATSCDKIIFYIVLLIVFIGLVFIVLKFFTWAKEITAIKNGKPNSVLGYNIAFDFMAWGITGIIIVISFMLYFLEKNELAVLIMGITIGSVLTRTPSFKEKK